MKPNFAGRLSPVGGHKNSTGECLHAAAAHRVYFRWPCTFSFFFPPAYIACWCIRMSERPLSVTQMVWKLVPTRSLVHSQGAASLLFRCRGALKECLSLSSLCGFEKSSTMPVLVISARGLYIRHGPCIGQSMQDPFCAEVQK